MAPAHWTKIYRATAPRLPCPEPGVPVLHVPAPAANEDCLYLDVEKPKGARAGADLPVMYEIHGGGFLSEYRTDRGTNLVRTGKVVYVYVSYRVGILGFLASPALGVHSGDYGLEDQQAGLRWVKHNIQKFGGDPNNVTIFGESAGGASVCAQLASPTARGLFQRAISISGFYNYHLNTIWWKGDCKSTLYSEEAAQRIGVRFEKKVGCVKGNVAKCLRRIPTATLLAEGAQFDDAIGGGVVGPIINGSTLTTSPARAFRRGTFAHVPLIIDVGANEFNGGMYNNLPNLREVVADTEEQYEALLRQQFGFSAEIKRLYNVDQFGTPFIAYRNAMADAASVCPLLAVARDAAKHDRVYVELDEDFDNPSGSNVRDALGALHSGTNFLVHVPADQLDANQRALQHQLLLQWTKFARDGSVNAVHAPKWQTFAEPEHFVMLLRSGGNSMEVQGASVGLTHNCPFWDPRVGY